MTVNDDESVEASMENFQELLEGVFIYRGSVGDYIVDTKRRVCSCPAYIFRKEECKHLRRLEKMSIDLSKADSAVETFGSSVEALSGVFENKFYSTDGTVGLYGLPDTGKSLFAIQDSFYLASQGLNTLYVGTEGGELSMINTWSPVMRARFKGNYGRMFFESRKTLDSLMEYLGFKVAVTFQSASGKKESGRMKVSVLGKIDAQIEKDVSAKKIKFLVVDSLSSPIRQAIPDDRENNTAKASTLSLILGRLNQIQEKYGVAVLVTSHAVRDPTNKYASVRSIAARGGVAFAHYCKKMIYLDARSSARFRDYRRFWIVGAENIPAFSVVAVAKITDAGFVNSDIDVDELLTDSEKKLKEGAYVEEEGE